ncbi:MAG: hypothetical protein JHC52_03965 [Chthoniobacterales bacterium]|jgi:hypothetical protein|nr:hypothetical protein [Chthoniobacterales bacterium]
MSAVHVAIEFDRGVDRDDAESPHYLRVIRDLLRAQEYFATELLEVAVEIAQDFMASREG